jgi:hypothetical protein
MTWFSLLEDFWLLRFCSTTSGFSRRSFRTGSQIFWNGWSSFWSAWRFWYLSITLSMSKCRRERDLLAYQSHLHEPHDLPVIFFFICPGRMPVCKEILESVSTCAEKSPVSRSALSCLVQVVDCEGTMCRCASVLVKLNPRLWNVVRGPLSRGNSMCGCARVWLTRDDGNRRWRWDPVLLRRMWVDRLMVAGACRA